MSLELDIQGRVAIVTGAGGGIGRSVCEHLAEAGALIAAVDVAAGAAESTAAAVRGAGGRALALQADVASAESVEAAVRRVLDDFGRIDVLFNGAGIYPWNAFLEMTAADWRRTIDVNLTGAFNCCHAVAPPMVERGFGRIINVASGHAFHGGSSVAHYAASKAGLLGLTRALAREFGPHGLRVNTIAPTITDTAMPRQHLSDAYLQQRAAANPSGRLGRPEDIAMGAVYLASRWAEFVNGQTLHINGGDTMH